MPFGERLTQTNTAIEVIDRLLWNTQPFANRIIVVPFGYETRVLGPARQRMINMHDQTAKYIRFTPDYFLIDQEKLNQEREPLIYLLDYKTTQTPIYSRNRIAEIAVSANIPNLTSTDIGQMEADAYANYSAIHRLGVRVVVLNYCAYHSRLLLCDFIENIRVLRQDRVTTQTVTGSRTPFTNFYCRSMRSLQEFLAQEHNITVNQQDYSTLCGELQTKLPVTHASASPDHPSNQRG